MSVCIALFGHWCVRAHQTLSHAGKGQGGAGVKGVRGCSSNTEKAIMMETTIYPQTPNPRTTTTTTNNSAKPNCCCCAFLCAPTHTSAGTTAALNLRVLPAAAAAAAAQRSAAAAKRSAADRTKHAKPRGPEREAPPQDGAGPQPGIRLRKRKPSLIQGRIGAGVGAGEERDARRDL